MARYVLVDANGFDKNIMGGPFDVEDPSTITVMDGQRVMLEEEAFAEGYHYAEGGGAGFAADQPAGADTAVQDTDEDHGHEGHGHGARGVQGREGGQGAQVQPGGEGQQR